MKNDNAEIAEALIRAGADIDVAGKLFNATPLHYAAVYDYFQTADMLLYYDAEKDKKTIEGSTPLLAATWAGNADIADLLVQKGANIEISDDEGFYTLPYGCYEWRHPDNGFVTQKRCKYLCNK